MIKRFVFDTNSLISANLLKHSVNRKAFDHAMETGILVLSDATFAEFAQTFIKPKFDQYLSLDKRLSRINDMEDRAHFIKPHIEIKVCRDPEDDMFLALAVSAEVNAVITGDKDLLVLHPFKNIPILSAADFLKRF